MHTKKFDKSFFFLLNPHTCIISQELYKFLPNFFLQNLFQLLPNQIRKNEPPHQTNLEIIGQPKKFLATHINMDPFLDFFTLSFKAILSQSTTHIPN